MVTPDTTQFRSRYSGWGAPLRSIRIGPFARVKLLFLGSHSSQSTATLSSLFESGVVPSRILVHDRLRPDAGRRLPLPIIGDTALAGPQELGARQGIPTTLICREQLAPMITEERPDMVLVSCLPFRISEELLSRVPLGWLNIHPSPLPAYRGPAPVFWQLRDGAESIGVTLHRMTGQLDRGPILDQAVIKPSVGATHSQIAALAGEQGGWMFTRLVSGSPSTLPKGKIQPAVEIPWHPKPQESDFEIDPSWGARHIFSFVKGVRELGTPLFPEPGGRPIPIDDALKWNAPSRTRSRSGERSDGIRVSCYDGLVTLLPVNRDDKS